MSTINSETEIQNQTTRINKEIVGTPFELDYSSRRVPGHLASNRIEIQLSDESVPESLKRIELEISVAGQQHDVQFPPEPDQSYTFTWNGKNAYGVPLQGVQPIQGRIGYVYDGVYNRPNPVGQSFGLFGSDYPENVEGSLTRQEITVFQDWTTSIGTWNSLDQGLGGWSVSVHHSYDPTGKTLYLGDGRQRKSDDISSVLGTVAGGLGLGDFSGDGGPASEAEFNNPIDVAVAPDGSIYVADSWNHRVRRIDPDGTVTTVAGSGPTAEEEFYVESSGDGGPATRAVISRPSVVNVGPDGNLYVIDNDLSDPRIRRIDEDGTITTVAGGGEESRPNGIPATQAELSPTDVALGKDGRLYILTYRGVLYRVSSDGIISVFAGGGEVTVDELPETGIPATDARSVGRESVTVGPNGDLYTADGDVVYRIDQEGVLNRVAGGGTEEPRNGIRATGATFDGIAGIVADSTGGVYLSDQYDGILYRVSPDGILSVVAGSGSEDLTAENENLPALQANLWTPDGLDIGPDESLYFAEGVNENAVRELKPALSGIAAAEIAVASDDGRRLFVFDTLGRHLRTVHTMTGGLLYQFGYENGFLVSIEDGDGNVTTIDRDDDGFPSSIESPYGQITEIATTDRGYIEAITEESGETTRFSYSDGGLLISYTDPEGNTASFAYDELGHVVREVDPLGSRTDYVQNEGATEFEVRVITDELRESSYRVEDLPSGNQLRVNTCCGDSGIRTEINRDAAVEQSVYPDGSRISVQETSDSRFGMESPFVKQLVTQTPGGLTQSITTSGSVEVPEGGSPVDVESVTNSVEINGRTYGTVFDGLTNEFVSTTPEGQDSRAVVDEQGRVVEFQQGEIDPVEYGYDRRGRLTEATQTNRTWTYEYDQNGNFDSITDPTGRTLSTDYGPTGRLLRARLPSGRTYRFEYDSIDNVERIRMPNDAAHDFSYVGDQIETYTSPAGNAYRYEYGPENELAREILPSGRQIQNEYDETGFISTQRYPEATVDISYTDARQIESLEWEAVTGGVQRLSIEHDGELLTQYEFAGVANGTFTYSFSDDFWVTSITYPNGQEVNLERDDDGLVSEYGPFALTRTGPNREPTRISGDALNVAYEYDTLGRVTTRVHEIGGQERYRVDYSYTALGTLSGKRETIDGVTREYEYEYDDDGRLIGVVRDGEPLERYRYDQNSNRTWKRVGTDDGTEAGYNSQDQLLELGTTSYEYDEDGYVVARGDDSFRYSSRDELLEATLEDGTTISYAYDGVGRRVAKTDDQGTMQYLYGNPYRPYQVTASRDSDGVLTTYHYDEGNRLFAMNRADTWYYVATDQVGTPKMVCDQSGEPMATFEYTTFGEPLSRDSLDFQFPIGFAGGITDTATELVRFGYRDYEPRTGRWTARDPIKFEEASLSGADLNLYEYALNDPVNFVDDSGLTTCWYSQSTGRLLCKDDKTGEYFADCRGYSGFGSHKNDPTSQCVKSKGPIPQGEYTIGDIVPNYKTQKGKKLPNSIPLKPKPGTKTCGRDGFLIHGDSSKNPGRASEGCIIQSPAVRQAIGSRGQGTLHVHEDESQFPRPEYRKTSNCFELK